MNSSLCWCGSARLHVLLVISIALCGYAATDSVFNATDNTTLSATQSPSSATPAPGGTEGVDPPEEVTPTLPGLNATVNGTLNATEEPTSFSEAPSAPTTLQPVVVTPQGCVCDLTPDFCDIGCCCDTLDCGVNLSTVFTGCPQRSISGVCVEKWLIFRANVNASYVTVTDSLFCVQPQDETPQSFPAVSQSPSVGTSYHFSPPEATTTSHGKDFYRTDDVIQTYFSNSSVRGLLRQPSPGTAALFCVNRNPAKFLRSLSASCTRMVTSQSCTTDLTLSARSYFSDLSLIKIPINEGVPVSDFLIPVTPLSEWPEPSRQNNSCVNAVKKVEFVIGYTGRGELTYATLNVVVGDVDLNQLLSQTHSVLFQLATTRPTPELPAVGLRFGSPLIGRFDEEVKLLSTLGVSQGGDCSSDPSRRASILFTHNTITGCTFSSLASNCSELRSEIYRILQGFAAPDAIAMNSGSQPDWTSVITQQCPVSLQVEETCETGCVLPNSLSVQVLWARQGLIDLPQNYILGAKYVFQCQNIKCPLSSPLTLTTKVMFADSSRSPQPPRGLPQPHWKFPFGFFTRGSAELDGHVINGSDSEKVTRGLMLLTAMLLTGLQLFTWSLQGT